MNFLNLGIKTKIYHESSPAPAFFQKAYSGSSKYAAMRLSASLSHVMWDTDTLTHPENTTNHVTNYIMYVMFTLISINNMAPKSF